ncbi:MAG: hypothetical protein QE269_06220 [Fimbriimonas sp.]|nr:hypothetical protein [Fimbriimonas sp.]
MTSKSSSGTRYRKFKVSGSTVKFETKIKGTASGISYISVQSQYSAAESPWAVGITSDRGTTYRRVMVNGTPKAVSNFLEDDELTARGGDGVVYGDSVISSPSFVNWYDWDFATTMEAMLYGPWSTWNTSGSFSVSKAPTNLASSTSWATLIGFDSSDVLVMGEDNMTPGTKTFTATVQASDSQNMISDSCVYKMTAHLEAESKKSKGAAPTQKLYRVHETFADYTGSHDPAVLLRIDAPTTEKWTITVSNSVSSTEGWEASGEGSLGFSIKMIDFHFGGSYTKSGSVTVSSSKSIEGEITVPGGTHRTYWALPLGTVTKYSFERYGNQGYVRDGCEFELTGYSETFTWTSGPLNGALVYP